jgi:2-oxoglutarate dehydrogenase E1 component
LQLCDQDETVPYNGEYKKSQVMAETNMQVVNCSTAAQYFHALRTHMRLPFRKPMVVVAPKKLLRFKGACSTIEDFDEGTKFKHLLTDTN